MLYTKYTFVALSLKTSKIFTSASIHSCKFAHSRFCHCTDDIILFVFVSPLGLEHLPNELQRNFTLMSDLDKRAQSLMKNIDLLADEHLRNIKSLTGEQQKEQLDKIQNMFNKAKELGDDKVQLAIQTYELVDKHIRRLDNDLARFESEIQDKALNSRNVDEPSSVGKSEVIKLQIGKKPIVFNIS
ncbi:hypothetical protein ABEB36_002042 [Hypothenemus hampei]|uniref:Inhibitor of growth protein N-terminal histone-binding domain-containing protein n=1 Tax=Hypothenemus hampei TaxID=57062 RepID=A0ABD1F4D5_HYPHA